MSDETQVPAEQQEQAVPAKKAYDIKELGKRLKAAGLIEAEDLAGKFYVETKEWLKESAEISKNPFDNMAIPFYAQLDAIVLPQIDKIDGEPG